MLVKLLRKRSVGIIVLAYHQYACGVAVMVKKYLDSQNTAKF